MVSKKKRSCVSTNEQRFRHCSSSIGAILETRIENPNPETRQGQEEKEEEEESEMQQTSKSMIISCNKLELGERLTCEASPGWYKFLELASLA